MITDVRKPENHGYDVIVGGELFTDYSDHLAKLVTLNPKLKLQALDATSFFPVMDAYRKKRSYDFPKSQDAVLLQQIKERGAFYLRTIVVISVRQSTVAAIFSFTLPGAGYGQFEHKADSLIAKFKRSGRNGQRD